MSESIETVVVIATLQAAEGKGPELLDVFAELVPAVLAGEPGTLTYAVHTVADVEPARVVVIEKYASRSAYEAHHHGTALAAAVPRLGPLLDGGIDTVVLHPADLAPTADLAGAHL